MEWQLTHPLAGDTAMAVALSRFVRRTADFPVAIEATAMCWAAGSVSIQYTFWLTQSSAIGLS